MAQHDYVISNGTGAAVRSDLNNALSAIVSQNSGATAPATTYAFQFWADTTTNTLKLRNSANSAWIELRQLDGDFTTVSVDNGTAAAPSIYFNASGTDTGIYSSGTDAVDISTAGTRRFGISSSGELTAYGGNLTLNAQGDLRFADSDSSNWVAFQSPATVSSNVTWTLPSADGTNGQALTTNGSGTLSWTSPAATTDKITEGNTEAEVVDTGSDGHFKVTTEGTERFRINSSGNVGIGSTTALGYKLNIYESGTGMINALHLGSGGGVAGNGASISFGLGNTFDPTANVLAKIGGIYTGGGYDGALTFSTCSNTSQGANPPERMRIDSAGRLLVGTSSTDSFYNSGVQIAGAGGSNAASQLISRFSADSASPVLYFQKSRGASVGTNTIVNNGDDLGLIGFYGANGTNANEAARITAQVDGAPGASNDMPGRLVFSTTADGASSPTERMRITSGGYLKASDTGNYQDAGGTYHEFLQSLAGNSLVNFRHSHSSNPFGIIIKYSAASPNGTANPFWQCNDSTTTRGELRSNGGIANYSGNNVNLSDINSKKDISPAAGTWDCIKEWEIVNYRYKDQPDDADLNFGVIAQQVAESCPEVITIFEEAKDDQPEKLGVKEQQMYWMAIKALQEAQVRIEQLEARLTAAGIE